MRGVRRLVLQPMDSVADVRAFMTLRCGWRKASDAVVVEQSRKRPGKAKG